MLIRDEETLTRALEDGRQSGRARMIQRGVGRLLYRQEFAVLYEFTLASNRRADMLAMSAKGELWVIEIKSSVADFKADQKWPEYQDYCDRFYFATHVSVPQTLFPEDQGLIVADGHGAEILRQGQAQPLAPARRKALLLSFATKAACRLHHLLDPGLRSF